MINSVIREKILKYRHTVEFLIIFAIGYFIAYTVANNKINPFYILGFILLPIVVLSKLRVNKLLAIFILIFPFNYWISIGKINVNLVESLILIMFFLWVFNYLLKGSIKYRDNSFNKWILAYILVSFILLFNSSLNDKDVYKAIARTIEFGMLFYVIVNNLPVEIDEKYFKKLSNLLLFGMMIVCFLGIIEYLIYCINYPDSFIEFHKKMILSGIYPPRSVSSIINLSYEGRTIGSTLGSKSALSIYLSIIIPLFFLKMIYAKGLNQKMVFIFVFLLGLFSLLLTGSRTGFFSLIIGVLLILFVLGRTRKIKIILTIVSGLLLFIYFLPEEFQQRLTFRSSESTISGRKSYMIRSLNIIKDNVILGAGIDSVGGKAGESKPHNAFLIEFQTKGIAAFIILIGLFFQSFRYSYKNMLIYKNDKSEIGIYAIWSFITVFIYFLISLAAEPFWENQTSVLFILAIAISVILRRNSDKMLEKS